MSRYFSKKYARLTPYTPGEQPTNMKYVKLNTNESPFPPSEKAIKLAFEEAHRLQLYSDPTCSGLNSKLAEIFNLEPDEVLVTNGSDEILNFAFMAFCDLDTQAAFPDITYGFYPVFADLNGIPYTEIPLKEDFSINPSEYYNLNKTIFIANPNAPTGIALSKNTIEQIVANNRSNVVVIDEAYVDFGAESCIDLIHKYDNLLVVQTFSKSRSMAGARIGFGAGCRELIRDLNTIKYSTNPYNINRMSHAAAIGALSDEEYTKKNCQTIIDTRSYTTSELRKRGFTVLDSKANFVFASSDKISGLKLYEELKSRGVLIRHFEKGRLAPYNRITIGSREQMDILLKTIDKILEEIL